MKPSAAINLANRHWEYVRALLEHDIPEDMSYSKAEYLENVGFHYTTALAHGIKHGVDWAKERNLKNAS